MFLEIILLCGAALELFGKEFLQIWKVFPLRELGNLRKDADIVRIKRSSVYILELDWHYGF